LGLQILASLGRVAIGFSLSAIDCAGIMIGINPDLSRCRPDLPSAAYRAAPSLPLSLAAFQQSPQQFFVIFITAIWPIIINTTVYSRFPGLQERLQSVATVCRSFLKFSYPRQFHIFTGLRIGIGLSWLAIVAAEMLTGGVGIGFFIWDAYNSSRLSEIILALIYVGLVGLLLDRLVGFIASKVVPEEQS